MVRANDAKLVVCAVIENGGDGGNGGGAGRRAGLREVLPRPPPPCQPRHTSTPTDARIRRITTSGTARRARGAAPPRGRPLPRLDPARRRRGARRRRALGRRRRHEVRASRAIRTTTSTARSSTRASGRSCSWPRRSSIRTSTAATGAPSSSAPSVVIAVVLLVGQRGARLDALDQPRLLHLPAVGVREAPVRARARGDARRAPARARTGWETTLRVVGLGLIPVVLVFAQPDLGTALVYLAALAAMLFVAGTPWRHLAVLGAVVVVVVVGVLWAGPAAGVNVLKGYQQQRLTCFIASANVLGRRGLQPRAVDGRGRLGSDPRPRPERLDARSSSASCPRAEPTSSSPASPSSAASSAP